GGELHGREREQEGRVGLVADVPPRFEVELVSLLCVERGRGVTQQSIELLVLDAGEWAIGAETRDDAEERFGVVRARGLQHRLPRPGTVYGQQRGDIVCSNRH